MRWICFSMLCSLLACAGGATAQTAAPAVASVKSALGGDAPEYTLQKGDLLEIRTYNLPELNTDVHIRPDGKISLLLLNDVQAAGLTARQLAAVLSESFSRHFRTPRVSVIVKDFVSSNVYVGGEVGQAGAVPLHGDLTAVQAVLRAGGFKENGGGDKILILRDTETGAPKTESVNVQDVIQNRQPDAMLRPSDVVFVPKSAINVYVGGEVAHPGLVPLNGDLTVLMAILQAGGFRETAKTDSVVLVRDGGKGAGPISSKIRLNDLFQDSTHTKLKPFDVVYVPKSRIAKLDKWVDQYLRQMVPATLSVGFSYLLGQRALVQQPPLF